MVDEYQTNEAHDVKLIEQESEPLAKLSSLNPHTEMGFSDINDYFDKSEEGTNLNEEHTEVNDELNHAFIQESSRDQSQLEMTERSRHG